MCIFLLVGEISLVQSYLKHFAPCVQHDKSIITNLIRTEIEGELCTSSNRNPHCNSRSRLMQESLGKSLLHMTYFMQNHANAYLSKTFYNQGWPFPTAEHFPLIFNKYLMKMVQN